MFGLGLWEFLLVAALALILFSRHLPKVGRQLGKMFTEAKEGIEEVQKEGIEESKKHDS